MISDVETKNAFMAIEENVEHFSFEDRINLLIKLLVCNILAYQRMSPENEKHIELRNSLYIDIIGAIKKHSKRVDLYIDVGLI